VHFLYVIQYYDSKVTNYSMKCFDLCPSGKELTLTLPCTMLAD
jgi:hypothetical protein